MHEDELVELTLQELIGGLWHTTTLERFRLIKQSGFILPSTEAGNPDGWKTLGGDDYCPYAKKLGGSSLFDFSHFNPEKYSNDYPLSSWREFVPYRTKWGSAAWIEIDRRVIAARLISGADVLERWNSERAYRHNFMPLIEAIHVGKLPCVAFKRAFLVRPEKPFIEELGL